MDQYNRFKNDYLEDEKFITELHSHFRFKVNQYLDDPFNLQANPISLAEGLLEQKLLSELEVMTMELKENHDLHLWNQRTLELYILQAEMFLCNQAIEDYPGVMQCRVHKNAIQSSPNDLAEQEAKKTLRLATSSRNIGFGDLHDIMKQSAPTRTTLKEIHT